MRPSARNANANPDSAGAIACQRSGEDRRKRVIWSLIYGSVQRRRRSARRTEDSATFIADWHSPSLMYVVVAILLLSATDAILTLQLLQIGAHEANIFMVGLIHGDLQTFAAVKMGLTGLGVIYLVIRNEALLFGRLQVRYVLHFVLVCYIALIGYELTLLSAVKSMM